MARYTVDVSEQSHIGSIFLLGLILAVGYMACHKRETQEEKIRRTTPVLSQP